MFANARTEWSVIEWPDRLRTIGRQVSRGLREIWRGIDTVSAVRHGTVPLSGHEQEQLAVRGDVDALMARARLGDEYATELLVRRMNDGLESR